MDERKYLEDISHLTAYLKNLDSRISRIEEELGIDNDFNASFTPKGKSNGINSDIKNADAEINYGENWFAVLAIFVFAIFFIFFLLKPYNGISQIIPPVAGIIFSGIVISLSQFGMKSFTVISRSFFGIGFLLLYFSLLRFFYFNQDPAISNKIIEGFFLYSLSGVIIYVSISRQSYFLILTGLILASISSLILNNQIIQLLTLAVLSSLIVLSYLKLGFGNLSFIVSSILLIYFVHLTVSINNPVINEQVHFVKTPIINPIFLILYMVIFSYGYYIKNLNVSSEGIESLISYLNAIISFILFVTITTINFKESIPILFAVYFITSLTIAIFYWKKMSSKYSTYIYSILAFIILSLAIVLSIPVPGAFIPLVWQSLIVIIFAIWFNSKELVASNFLIFLIIFLSYLVLAGSLHTISLSFGIIALISARLLNWQKERLTIRTELIRNTYLGVAFLVFPLTIIIAFPNNYVGISLIALATLYYILSFSLKNIKYRWMAHFTLVGTVVYVLLFGLNSLDSTFQIITLLALTISLISVSILFKKMKRNLH